MTLSRGRIIAWAAANVVAAIGMPVLMFLWSRRLVAGSDGSLPDGFAPATLVLLFTLAWLVFLTLLNTAILLFVWLTSRRS